MMYLLKYKPFAAIVGGLLIFSACSKDSNDAVPDPGPDPVKDSVYAKPVVDPLNVAASKPGDTLFIKGTNFSKVASENVVNFNGVAGTVVSATVVSTTGGTNGNETVIELKVVIPATATTGTVTVTVHNNTVEVGSVVIAPLTYYVIKGDFTNGSEYKLITMNPKDGTETLVTSIGQNRINDVIYFPATNEIMGVDDDGSLLTRINVTTKQVITKKLPSGQTKGTAQLVVDKNNNLYGITYDWSGAMQTQTLVKIDPATGNTTAIKTFTEDDDWYEPVYVAATNEIVGLMNDGKRLFKVNLTTKDTAGIILPGSAEAEYRELIVDDKSNLYAYKGRYPGDGSDLAKLVKVNITTGQETLVKSLPVDGKFHDKIIFAPQSNEFIGTWNQYGLVKINATSLNLTSLTLVTDYSRTYNYFTSN